MLQLRILALATLLSLALAGTFELSLSRKRIRQAKPNAKRYARTKRSTVDDIKDYFVTEVAIGTPPQRFSVALQLNTAALSVPDKSCIPPPKCPVFCKTSLFCKALCPSACCDAASLPPSDPNCDSEVRVWDCGSRRKFDRSKSSTYQLGNGWWFCDGGSITDAVSFQGIDTVRIDDGNGKQLAIQNATFGEIYQMDAGDKEQFDGIFGIGVSNHSIPIGYTPPVLTAYQQGVISDPFVTLWVDRSVEQSNNANSTMSNAGTLTIGGLNTKKCGPVTEWHPIQPDLYFGGSWGGVNQDLRLVMKKVSLGDASVDTDIDPDINPPVINLNSDIGDNILEAGEYIKPIVEATGAKYDRKTGLYKITCDATFPPLRLKFDSTEYLVQPKDLIRKTPGSDYCSVKILVLGSDDPYVSLLGSYCYSIDVDKKLMTFTPNLSS